MKIRAVIAGLALLMLVFCPVGLSHAAKSLRNNINSYPPVDEHPWQHGDAPNPGNDFGLWLASRVVVVTILPSLQTILFVPHVGVTPDSGTKATRLTSPEPDDDHFSGAR